MEAHIAHYKRMTVTYYYFLINIFTTSILRLSPSVYLSYQGTDIFPANS